MSGSIKGEDMRADDSAYDDSSLESKIAQHLNAIEGESQPPKPDLAANEPEADDDVRLSGDDPDGDDGEPSPKLGADGGAEAGKKSDSDTDGDDDVAIDEAHYHAAISAGWEPEKISRFLKADPELAQATFEKLYKDTNELSRQFAQIGRTRLQLEEQAAVQQRVQPQPQQVEDPLVAKLNALKANPEHADDPLIGLVEEMIKSRPQQPVQQTQQPLQQQPDPEVQRELDLTRVQQVATFLNSDRMKSYEEFYGPAFRSDGMPIYDATGLSPGQVANRRALLDEADAIWLGFQAHGRDLSAEEALTKAHLNLTEPMREQKIREELVGKVKKRAAGKRLKPSKSKAPPAKEGTKPNEAELEARTTQRLATLRGA